MSQLQTRGHCGHATQPLQLNQKFYLSLPVAKSLRCTTPELCKVLRDKYFELSSTADSYLEPNGVELVFIEHKTFEVSG